LGTVPFTAQMIGGLASFVPESFATGLLIVVNTYVAQNLGAKLYDRCGQYARAGIILALCFCLLIFPLVFLAQPIFAAFNAADLHKNEAALQHCLAAGHIAATQDPTSPTATHPATLPTTTLAAASPTPTQAAITSPPREKLDKQIAIARAELQGTQELISLEVMFFRYMVLAVFLTLTARPLEQFFFGVQKPHVVLGASIAVNVVNLVLAYILVFGQSGLIVLDNYLHTDIQHSALGRLNIPKFGLEGAAWANLASWGLNLAILAAVFFSKRINDAYITRRLRVQVREIFDLVRIGWPAGVQFLHDVLPWYLMLGWLIEQFGKNDQAATTAAMRWMPVSFMPAVGIGVATTALVGKYIGQGQPLLARRRAHAGLVLGLIYMGCCGVIFYVFRHQMVQLFITVAPAQEAAGDAQKIIDIGGKVMVCAAVFQLFDAVGIVYLSGLRGAGDTFWPMIMTIVLSWSLIIGGGYFMVAEFPSLGSIGPWISASGYIAVLGLAMAWRFERGRWQKINLVHREAIN
jgi:MATE family multidrug resistance protein